MALALFPELSGLTFDTVMTPNFSTGIARQTDGSETRNSFQQYPTWDFEISYEWLPNRRAGNTDLETILGFWLSCRGAFQSFLYKGPEIPTESNTLLGIGNGVATDFLLTRTVGSFVEPAGGIFDKTGIAITDAGSAVASSAFNLIDNRTISFTTPPVTGHEIRGTYLPLFRCRFKEDTADYQQFYSRLWQLQQLGLKGVFS